MKFIAKNGIRALGFTLQMMVYSPIVSAQMAMPQEYFTESVPDDLREPFAKFLDRLGMKNPTNTTRRTKFQYIGDAKSLGFRIDDSENYTCVADRCMTIIGQIVEQRFVVSVMFLAGPKATRMDSESSIFGLHAFPIILTSPHGNVALIETSEGWVVAPAGR